MAFPRRHTIILLFVAILFISISHSISEEKQQDIDHDKQNVQGITEDDQDHDDKYHAGIKCGSCPCINPCSQKVPPPPPKVQCSPVVMPPPPPRFIYVTSVPERPWQANIVPNNNWHYFYNSATGKMVVEYHLFFFCAFLALLQLPAFG